MLHARTTALCALAGTAVMVAAAPTLAQVRITKTERVNAAGEPVMKGGVYIPSLPKVPSGAFDLICPSDSFEKEITTEAEVKWSSSVGAQAGVEWGPVQAGVEASLGVEIGKKVTFKRTYKYAAAPWYSRRYCIFPAYGRFKVTGTDARGTPFTVFVLVPEGTYTFVEKIPPDCPCEEVAAAAQQTDAYASTLPPGSPAQTLVSQATGALETALFGGYDSLATNLGPVAGLFAEAAAVGADPLVLDGIMMMASRALDAGVEMELAHFASDDPATGGAFSTPEHVIQTASLTDAAAALGAAREIVATGGPLERWLEALALYDQGVQGVFAGHTELKEVMADPCDAAGVGALPALCCPADCNGDGAVDFFDFLCFQDLFAAGDPYADCDGSGALDFFDFLCFQDQFAAGCD